MGNGFTFSNGVYVPPGSSIGTTIYPIHADEKNYPNPLEFDGFRFCRLRDQEGESARHHASNTSHEYLYFGHGQHAWYLPIHSLPQKGFAFRDVCRDSFCAARTLTLLVPDDSSRSMS